MLKNLYSIKDKPFGAFHEGRTGSAPFSIACMVKGFVLGLIKLYQKTTWFLPHRCRFYPSCSSYMLESIQAHGTVHGIWLGLKRLGRCHPLHPGGLDPVPQPHSPHPSI